MGQIRYLLIHKDHPFSVKGVNSGAEVATLLLARALTRLGRKVIVAAQLSDGEQEDQGVLFWDLGPSYDVDAILTRARAQGSYHLISAGRAQPIMQSRRESACQSRVLISHDRAGSDSGIKPSVLAQVADRIVCVSEAQRKMFLESGAPQERTITIHNGVDLDLFEAGDPSQRNLQRLVFVGALVPDKGLHILIESFAALKSQFPKLELDVYGSADLWGRAEYLDQAQIHKQQPDIRFHGKQPRSVIAKALRESSLCIVPSIWFDPFPLTSLEAQACGCPVVAFDVGGLREGIRNGESGLVVSEVTVPALTSALQGLLSKPEKLLAMSKQALRQREYFDWQRVARDVTGLCETTISAASKQAPTGSAKSKLRVAWLSTWQQPCGLATYAQFLINKLLAAREQGTAQTDIELLICAEEHAQAQTAKDQTYVRRCWQRSAQSFVKLSEALQEFKPQILHLNLHDHAFIPAPAFRTLLQEQRRLGVKVVAHFHTTFTRSLECQQLLACLDSVVVHSPEARLQLIANGASSTQVRVLAHGVELARPLSPALSAQQIKELRQKLNLPIDQAVLVAPGFIQPSKGMEVVVEGLAAAREQGIKCQAYILGALSEHPDAKPYLAQIKALSERLGVQQYLTIIDSFQSDQDFQGYLQAADIVLLNYQAQYYEASGVCSLAVAASALGKSVVATSLAPAFQPFADAVWRLTAGFPARVSVPLLLGNQELRAELQLRARDYAENHQWSKVAAQFEGLYMELKAQPMQIEIPQVKAQAATPAPAAVAPEGKPISESVSQSTAPAQASAKRKTRTHLRILMQHRPNVFTNRGGDSVVLERLMQGLRAAGVEVSLDLNNTLSPAEFDLVHLYNFALPDFTRGLAQRAYQAGIPYVVTTLHEDLPCYRNQGMLQARNVMEYVERGQDRKWYAVNAPAPESVTPAPCFDNRWTAEHAAALFPNGAAEAAALRKDYGSDLKIVEIKLGSDLAPEVSPNASADAFVRAYDVKDFILCVGRLEFRKNQLMLLKAFEESALPIVLAAGGFSWDPELERAVRRFKRKGRTVIADRMEPQMLASCYKAARVHVLPSWYELPGLVSLEAARFGCNVAVTELGTSRDYLGEHAFYVRPDSEYSIVEGTLGAYYSPPKAGLRECVERYTWEACARETLQAYEKILSLPAEKSQPKVQIALSAAAHPKQAPQPTPAPAPVAIAPNAAFDQLVAQGELAARSKNIAEGQRLMSQAEAIDGRSLKVLRTRAALFLAESKFGEAERYFRRALEVAAADARSLTGLAMCEINSKRHREAQELLIKALAIEPDQVTGILQMVECAYTLGSFEALEAVLARYLELKPQDLQFKFCHAGALYMLGRLPEAKRVNAEILAKDAAHRGALELKAKLEEKSAATVQPSPMLSEQSSARQNVIAATTVDASSPSVAPDANKKSATLGPVLERALGRLSQRLKKGAGATTEAVATAPEVPVTLAAAPTATNNARTSFDEADRSLLEIEECKRKKQHDEALQRVEKLAASGQLSHEQRERLELIKAEVLVAQRKVDLACVIYEAVLKRSPRNPRALCGKGAIEAHRDNWAQARTLFEQAHEIDAQYDVPLAGLGLCAWREQEFEKAWGLYRQASKLNPENMRALLGIIELGYQRKRFTEIEEALRAYLELHPLDLEFLYSLAGCLFAQQRLQEAAKELDKITMFEPSHKNALELRRMIDERPAQASASA